MTLSLKQADLHDRNPLFSRLLRSLWFGLTPPFRNCYQIVTISGFVTYSFLFALARVGR